jgi:hypothetical protein
MQRVRKDLNGAWILDKTRGQPSMRGYLETMGVNELAIEAHEKGELETDTVHIIEFTAHSVRIKKLSRVNDCTLEVALQGRANNSSISSSHYPNFLDNNDDDVDKLLDLIPPDPQNEKQRSIALSDNPTHVTIYTKMKTINGTAAVTDVKTLLTDDVDIHGNILPAVLKQELTIRNESNGKTHITTRYFVPHRIEGEYDDDEEEGVTNASRALLSTTLAQEVDIQSDNGIHRVDDNDSNMMEMD